MTRKFTRHGTLGIDVPAEVRDALAVPYGGETGTATHGRFRRFHVRTEVR